MCDNSLLSPCLDIYIALELDSFQKRGLSHKALTSYNVRRSLFFLDLTVELDDMHVYDDSLFLSIHFWGESYTKLHSTYDLL